MLKLNYTDYRTIKEVYNNAGKLVKEEDYKKLDLESIKKNQEPLLEIANEILPAWFEEISKKFPLLEKQNLGVFLNIAICLYSLLEMNLPKKKEISDQMISFNNYYDQNMNVIQADEERNIKKAQSSLLKMIHNFEDKISQTEFLSKERTFNRNLKDFYMDLAYS